MLLRSALAVAMAGMLLASAGASAQTSGKAPPESAPTDQNAPQHFDSQGKKGNDQSLTERLDRSDGVIRPPSHVDRDMLQSPPPTSDGDMVIKPRPDSEQQVQPK